MAGRKRPGSTDAAMKATLRATYREQQRRRALPYDGLMGEPPRWIHASIQHDFSTARTALLEAGTEAQAQEWMQAAREIQRVPGGEVHRVPVIPLRLLGHVFRLVEIQRLVEMGPDAADRELVGPDARSALNSERAKKRRQPRRTPAMLSLDSKIEQFLAANPEMKPREIRAELPKRARAIAAQLSKKQFSDRVTAARARLGKTRLRC